ncbi:MAG: DUF349 domain-containing protein [Cryomorphaceae bacterium]|nr:DUF349 domain-containing protein [Cryomorphaceae bacterium]
MENQTENVSEEKNLSLEEQYGSLSAEALVKEAKKHLAEGDVLHLKDTMDYIKRQVLSELDEELNEKKRAFIEDGGSEIDFEYQQPLRDAFYEVYKLYRQKKKEKQNAIAKEQQDNLQRKKDIIEEIKTLAQTEESLENTFPAFRALQEAWRNTGNVPRAEMNELYRNYNLYVEAFYDYLQINRELRDLDFKKNKEAKEVLIAKAELLAEQEDVIDAMRNLQQLHKQWKEIGPVDREEREEMWRRFSEATKRIHEKRDAFEETLLKEAERRIELKRKVCDLLEAIDLTKIKSHNQWQKTMKALNEANEQYKSIGFAKHPDNDVLWDRFRAINRSFHRAKNDFYKEMKKSHQENLEAKQKLVEKAVALKESEDWKGTSDALKRLQREWKAIGPVAKKDNEAIWGAFREACDHFFNRMKAHYSEKDEALGKNLEKKEALLNQLKSIEEVNRDVLMTFLKDWKDIGPVPRDKRSIEFAWNDLIDKSFSKIDMDKTASAIIRYRAKTETLAQEGPQALDKEMGFLRKKMEEAKRELSQLEENMLRITGSKDSPFMKEAMKNIRHREEQISLLKEKIKVVKDLKSNNQ